MRPPHCFYSDQGRQTTDTHINDIDNTRMETGVTSVA